METIREILKAIAPYNKAVVGFCVPIIFSFAAAYGINKDMTLEEFVNTAITAILMGAGTGATVWAIPNKK